MEKIGWWFLAGIVALLFMLIMIFFGADLGIGTTPGAP